MVDYKKIMEQYRLDHKLSQAEMAEKLGISQQVYSNIESGKKKKLTVDFVVKYKEATGINLWETGEKPPEQVRSPKIETDPEKEGVTFVDIAAQAGYSKNFLNPMFKSSLKKIFIPGMPYRGENYRIWEVEGNSMEPTFKEGFYVLTEKVEGPWSKIKEHHAHVIVTQDDVYLKRIAHSKTKEGYWALISDNEDLYPPFLLPVEEVKELWFVRRKMDWEMSPPKRFNVDI